MDDPALDALRWQFEMTWRLAAEHVLPGLTDEMCLWTPAPGAWTVRRVDGALIPDWADEEPDPPMALPPPADPEQSRRAEPEPPGGPRVRTLKDESW